MDVTRKNTHREELPAVSPTVCEIGMYYAL